MHKTLQHMPHSIHIGMPYVVHNEIQYINMRGRVVRKKTAFFASIFGLTTIKQAYIPPPPLTPPTTTTLLKTTIYFHTISSRD